MKLTIDTDARTLVVEDGGKLDSVDLYSPEAFAQITRQWLRVSHSQKHTYTFTWFGRPTIQLPEDMIRIQEVIYQQRPDVIIECGIAHGGSLVYWASLCKAMESGRVIGVDVEIRPHNRAALENHPLKPYITLIEGNSVDPAIVDQVRAQVTPGETVLVILDSNHSYRHVLGELRAYGDLVTPGSYILVQDGLLADLWDVWRERPEWKDDNPKRAAEDFVVEHPEFVLEPPKWAFNESYLTEGVTQFPSGWLRKRTVNDRT